MTSAGKLKVISIGLDPTIALVDPPSAAEGLPSETGEYAEFADTYTGYR